MGVKIAVTGFKVLSRERMYIPSIKERILSVFGIPYPDYGSRYRVRVWVSEGSSMHHYIIGVCGAVHDSFFNIWKVEAFFKTDKKGLYLDLSNTGPIMDFSFNNGLGVIQSVRNRSQC